MLNKCKIVMLSTNQQTKYLMVYSDVEKTKGKLILNGLKNDEYKEYQHLYIISDDEIKKGDYYIIDNIPELLKNNGLRFIDNYCKKVIATTDTSLYIHQKETMSLPERVFYLPQPSQQFIQKYIEEYNRGNIITDVLVEYELVSNEEYFLNTINPDDGVPYFDENLKINPKDNTITIKKVKDSYTKEEVDRLLDEQASKTTAKMIEKFKGYKSKDEVIDLIVRAVGESHDWSIENNDIHSIGIIEKRFLSKWIEENL